MNKELIKYSSLACFFNLLISWIPFSPILCFIGSGASARLYASKINSLHKQLQQKQKTYFCLLSSLFSALVSAFTFLVFFYFIYLQPLSEDWLKIELFDQLIADSVSFKYLFFLSCFAIAFTSSYLGSTIAFTLGIGSNQISEQEYLEKLDKEKFAEYLS